MEDLVIVKASDVTEALQQLFSELKELRKEIEDLRSNENDLKAYTAIEAAKLIGFHPKTVRKMVRKKILMAVHAASGKGQYRITAASIREYLERKKENNKPIKK